MEQQKRILVVDDEQDLCDILLFNLSAAGYQAEAAYSAEEALQRIENSKSANRLPFDLLLLDVMMPDMSGFELARRLKADAPSQPTPIIFLTAKDSEDDTLHGFSLGADDYVTKPFSVREVTARVKAVLGRSQSSADEHVAYEGLQLNVSELVADIAQETAIALDSRQMTLRNYLPQSIIINGNYSLLYSIFRNLMDNAVNYAERGTTVEISATQQSDGWLFCFKDNGVGIPASHQARIFERFYRIDKGRSRDMGGTGLGLSIVKNAVLLHGGTIDVSTPPAGGLAFEFTLRQQ